MPRRFRVTLISVSKTLTIRLSDELVGALRREARRCGIPTSELARRIIAERLHKTGSSPVIAKYFGVIRGPADLSTNRSYRRAWTNRT